MSNLKKQFGARLLQLRQERGLTQEQFAELIGISVPFLSLIERGKNCPSFDTLAKIAARLNLCVKDMFDFRRSC